jgi:hypothetical protein
MNDLRETGASITIVCNACRVMSALIALAIAGAVCAVAAVVAFVRRRPSHDLGSVSTAWTTQHNVGYRGGDSSAN